MDRLVPRKCIASLTRKILLHYAAVQDALDAVGAVTGLAGLLRRARSVPTRRPRSRAVSAAAAVHGIWGAWLVWSAVRGQVETVRDNRKPGAPESDHEFPLRLRRSVRPKRLCNWRRAVVSGTPNCLTLAIHHLSFLRRRAGRSAEFRGWRRQLHCLSRAAVHGRASDPGQCHKHDCAMDGAAASGGAYRKRLDVPRRVMIPLLAASLIGGLVGALSAAEDSRAYLHARSALAHSGRDFAVCLRQETGRRTKVGDRARGFELRRWRGDVVSIVRRRLRRLLRRRHGHRDARHAGRAGHDRYSRHERAEERDGIRHQRSRRGDVHRGAAQCTGSTGS